MNIQNAEDVFWKSEDGKVNIPLTEMTEEHFIKAYTVIQKRQIKAFSALEMSMKIEDAMVKVAKKRGIKLIQFENSDKSEYLLSMWNYSKDLIKRINRMIKLNITKNGKQREVVL